MKPLSVVSTVVKGLLPVGKVMLYCQKEDMEEAKKRIYAVKGESG